MKIEDLLIPKKYKPDLMVDNKVIVEPKATSGLTKVEEAQLLNYLKATKLRIGLLLNSGTKSCTYSILCGYLHIKSRDYTRLIQKSCGNLCNLVVPTQGTQSMFEKFGDKKKNLVKIRVIWWL